MKIEKFLYLNKTFIHNVKDIQINVQQKLNGRLTQSYTIKYVFFVMNLMV